MKKLSLSLLGFLLVTIAISQTTISKEERKKALSHLKDSQSNLMSLVGGLNEDQLNFKVNEESWSIANCMEHIAISEENLMGMVKMSLKEQADPSKRAEVAMSDNQLIGIITSREQKVKTRKEFEPTNSFGGFSSTIKTFKERRKENMKFVKSTDMDLRNHYIQFPFGLIDSYQGIMFISGHTQRHADQIKEIMESEGFPG
ncbi:DinB family protein [Ekhidna sp.]